MSRQSDLRYSSATQMSHNFKSLISVFFFFIYKLGFGIMSPREHTDKEAVEQFDMYESTAERFSIDKWSFVAQLVLYIVQLGHNWVRESKLNSIQTLEFPSIQTSFLLHM